MNLIILDTALETTFITYHLSTLWARFLKLHALMLHPLHTGCIFRASWPNEKRIHYRTQIWLNQVPSSLNRF